MLENLGCLALVLKLKAKYYKGYVAAIIARTLPTYPSFEDLHFHVTFYFPAIINWAHHVSFAIPCFLFLRQAASIQAKSNTLPKAWS